MAEYEVNQMYYDLLNVLTYIALQWQVDILSSYIFVQ